MLRKGKQPKPRLYKVIFQAHCEPMLSFHNFILPAALEIKGYPQWRTDRLTVNLHDYDKRCSLNIESRSFGFDQDSDDSENEKKRIQQALEILPKSMNIPFFLRLGYRRYYLIPVSMSFKELGSILSLKLFSQNDQLKKILPSQLDDLSYRVDYSDKTVKYHIYLGPVRKEEIPKWINFSQNDHLDPKTRLEDYTKVKEEYPEVAVFIDIDIYRNGDEIPLNESLPFYEEAQTEIENMVMDFSKYIFSAKVKG